MNIIGGSRPEERLAVLDGRMAERGIDREQYAWYRYLAPLRHGAARRLWPSALERTLA